MPTRLAAAAILAILVTALPGRAAAQGPSSQQAAATLRLAAYAATPRPAGAAADPLAPAGAVADPLALADTTQSGGNDGTILGLVIGGAAGFGGGWAFYDAICEAVDNDCADSRLPHLLVGTAVGAGLGALVGSLLD